MRTRVRASTTFLTLYASGVVLATVLGGVFNVVNGWVSPLYFVTIMHWQGASDVWKTSIQQGLLEGAVSGLVLSAPLVTGLATISRGRCSFEMGIRYLVGVFASISLCWTFGGIMAMILALANTEFYQSAFIGVPSDLGEMLRYAWVGGSIWGAYGGSVLAIVVALIIFQKRQKQHRFVSVNC